ncbi:hypothetical protein GCM10010466_52600 [Planomonospora alba]|uniref:MFS transporter n=1 Tax=Planomonospora alba TaxID=161354 RepID=A0ABP6NQW9_9ACTN
MSARLPLRLARAAVFAVVCLGLSVAAHLFAGGRVSGAGALGGLALAFAAAAALSGRERTPAVIVPLLAGLQAAGHVVFSLTGGAAPAAAPHTHSGLLPALGMLAMHGWAAVLVSLWLARGEAALWALLRRLPVRLRRVLRVHAVPEPVPFFAVRAAEPRALRPALLRHAVRRRGPPVRRAAVPG